MIQEIYQLVISNNPTSQPNVKYQVYQASSRKPETYVCYGSSALASHVVEMRRQYSHLLREM